MEIDPENTVASLDEAQRARAKSQRIPSFRDYLTIAKDNNQIVIWDFKAMKLNDKVGKIFEGVRMSRPIAGQIQMRTESFGRLPYQFLRPSLFLRLSVCNISHWPIIDSSLVLLSIPDSSDDFG